MGKNTHSRENTPEQFFEDILKELKQLKKDFKPKEPEEYLTRKEVADLLKIDLSTLYIWSKNGTLKRYGINKRVYYKRSEIELILEELIVIK